MTSALDQKGLEARITAYLSSGGLFNPELANHEVVRDLLIDCRAYLSTVIPAEIAEVVEKLRDADNVAKSKVETTRIGIGLLREAATLIERLAASQPELATLRARVEKAEWERDDAIATTKLLQQQLKIQNDSFADRLSEAEDILRTSSACLWQNGDSAPGVAQMIDKFLAKGLSVREV